jgi:glycosyltransferase involved in cell wall biosynthesis
MTPSQRSQAWAMYFQEYGYKPVIITRRWDHKITGLRDVSRETPQELVHEIQDTYEVYYVPYKSNLRDRLFVKYGDSKYRLVRRLLTLAELVLQPFFDFVIPYNNIYAFALKYLQEHPDVKKMVVTGNPFNMFKFGYKLHKATGIRWIADYRDAWTTSTINFINKGWIYKLVNALDVSAEKKWVGTASLITASSQPIADGVSHLVKKPGYASLNGFLPGDFDDVVIDKKFDDFTITYVGTLYDGQKIELFCEAFKRLIVTTPGIKAKMLFPGLAFFDGQNKRVENAMRGFEAYYECTNRVERKKMLEIEKRSHLLLYVAWDEHKGIIGSKIYEYLDSGTYIIITPTDEGSVQEIVENSGCGVCTHGVEDTFAFLKSEYDNYIAGRYRVNDTTSDKVMQYSRKNQVKKMAEMLHKI